jgi:hypothetical protein
MRRVNGCLVQDIVERSSDNIAAGEQLLSGGLFLYGDTGRMLVVRARYSCYAPLMTSVIGVLARLMC